jgi:UDP-2,4-diacetamido-2,4,6-trideoxy-beta-L-altropyranose hydrolase
VMRCLTLAQALHVRGASIRFAVNAEAWSCVPALKIAKFPIATVATLMDTSDWEQGADALVFDAYDIGHDTEKAFRAKTQKIIILDDLANRRHDCDVLVDSTLGRSEEDYARFVPAGSRLLVGTNYTLLRPEFAALRPQTLAHRSKGDHVVRILVSLGLTDVGGITAEVVSRILEQPLAVAIDVVIGPAAQSRTALERLFARDDRIMLHNDPPDMARLMADADLAVGAGGVTCWERCCLGLPTVVLVLAENQRHLAKSLHAAGAASMVAGTTDAELTLAVQSLSELVLDEARRKRMSLNASALVDGQGTGRVAAALLNEIARAGVG